MSYDPQDAYEERFPCRFDECENTTPEDGEWCQECADFMAEGEMRYKPLYRGSAGFFTRTELEELLLIRPEMRRFA